MRTVTRSTTATSLSRSRLLVSCPRLTCPYPTNLRVDQTAAPETQTEGGSHLPGVHGTDLGGREHGLRPAAGASGARANTPKEGAAEHADAYAYRQQTEQAGPAGALCDRGDANDHGSRAKLRQVGDVTAPVTYEVPPARLIR